jgi:hypothetical protein
MKAKKPTLKQVEAVRCPTCGAGPGEKCELSTGQPRTEPHRDRRLIASDCRRVTTRVPGAELKASMTKPICSVFAQNSPW